MTVFSDFWMDVVFLFALHSATKRSPGSPVSTCVQGGGISYLQNKDSDSSKLDVLAGLLTMTSCSIPAASDCVREFVPIGVFSNASLSSEAPESVPQGNSVKRHPAIRGDWEKRALKLYFAEPIKRNCFNFLSLMYLYKAYKCFIRDESQPIKRHNIGQAYRDMFHTPLNDDEVPEAILYSNWWVSGAYF